MTVADKEYGKLSEDQFKRLIEKLPEFRSESKQREEVMRSASKEKLRESELTFDLDGSPTRARTKDLFSQRE